MPPSAPPPPTQWTRQAHSATSAQPKQQQRGGVSSKLQQQQQRQLQQPRQLQLQQQLRQHANPSPSPSPSLAVTALQKLISHIENPPPKSASQRQTACFCQSRTHPLSPYTPQCTSCGLVLCSLNPPFHPCPFAACGAPLLTDHAKRALVDQLSAQVAQTIADEEDARRREDEARVRAAGAFPELGSGGGGGGGGSNNNIPLSGSVNTNANASTNRQQQQQQQQFHKVLSLSGKGKITATYTRISPSPSSPSLHAKVKEEEDTVRVPLPPEGPEFVKLDPAELNSKEKKKTRLYENLRGEGPVYVPLPSEEKVTSDAREGSGRRRRPRKKNHGKENQPRVLEAGPSSRP